LHGLGLDLNVISWIAVPLTAGWCALSIWLARKQRVLAEAQEQEEARIAKAA
jgi:phosphate/sulfate permease